MEFGLTEGQQDGQREWRVQGSLGGDELRELGTGHRAGHGGHGGDKALVQREARRHCRL